MERFRDRLVAARITRSEQFFMKWRRITILEIVSKLIATVAISLDRETATRLRNESSLTFFFRFFFSFCQILLIILTWRSDLLTNVGFQNIGVEILTLVRWQNAFQWQNPNVCADDYHADGLPLFIECVFFVFQPARSHYRRLPSFVNSTDKIAPLRHRGNWKLFTNIIYPDRRVWVPSSAGVIIFWITCHVLSVELTSLMRVQVQ